MLSRHDLSLVEELLSNRSKSNEGKKKTLAEIASRPYMFFLYLKRERKREKGGFGENLKRPRDWETLEERLDCLQQSFSKYHELGALEESAVPREHPRFRQIFLFI